MTISDRLTHLNSTLAALDAAWPRIVTEIQARIDTKTLQLIASENEQARGAIKALRELLNLPETLLFERESINAALLDLSNAE